MALLVLVALAGGLSAGCAARPRRDRLIDNQRIKVDLVREVKGFTTEPRGFEHPAVISKERVRNILSAVEVETRKDDRGILRQPAFHPEIVDEVARSLSKAFSEASPDQEIGVLTIRKEMRMGVFHKKYLTSFLAYMDDGHLYLLLNRVDWPIPQSKKTKRLPKPRRDRKPMDFRAVNGEHMYYVGSQALEIAWQDPVFRTAYRLPGSTRGEKRKREILAESPMTTEERKALRKEGIGIDQLTPDQLRALADLEEDRSAGRITEAAYQRARRQLLRDR
ncbi:MAG: hypothetical protein CL908_03685 [Deltaproteobacteria bacterium]|nr:hypothetical protein [Deltaproteobacteria bacterium]